MALVIPIEIAAIKALRDYLATELPDVRVSEEWPVPGRDLPDRALTILIAGTVEEDIYEPYPVDSTPLGPITTEYTWAVAGYEIPLQLDVWAINRPSRNDIVARAKTALRQGIGRTLGIANAEPIRNGVLLPLANGWAGNVDVLVDSTTYIDDPDRIKANEFRATLTGEVFLQAYEKATSAKIASLRFRQRLREIGAPSTYTGTYDLQATKTATGTTYTKDVT